MKKGIFLFVVVLLFSACNSEQKKQHDWITNFLPEYLWNDITYDALNEEYHRIYLSLVDKANDAIAAYNKHGQEEDLQQMQSMYLWGLGDLYQLGGGNADNVKKRNAAIEKYKKKFESVTGLLARAIGSYINYRDSSCIVYFLPTYDDIFNNLIGTPGKIAADDDELVYGYSQQIAMHTLGNVYHPIVTNCEYNKEKEMWIVRFDNADNQYVKFYERNDGDYDVEYSSSLKADETPDAKSTITVKRSEREKTKKDSFASKTSSTKNSNNNGSNRNIDEGMATYDSDNAVIPESMWEKQVYSGIMSDSGKSYKITMTISFPGNGEVYSSQFKAIYQYSGHADSIVLNGSWLELRGYGYLVNLSSDEFLERFDLEFNGEDLRTTTVLTGEWRKYANEHDYSWASDPQKSMKVELKLN